MSSHDGMPPIDRAALIDLTRTQQPPLSCWSDPLQPHALWVPGNATPLDRSAPTNTPATAPLPRPPGICGCCCCPLDRSANRDATTPSKPVAPTQSPPPRTPALNQSIHQLDPCVHHHGKGRRIDKKIKDGPYHLARSTPMHQQKEGQLEGPGGGQDTPPTAASSKQPVGY